MAEFTGTDLYAAFIHSGGTLVLSADYRSLNTSPTIGLVKASAGSDKDESYITTLKDGKYTWKGVAMTGGTVLENALLEGNSGTLIIGREGTATGKPKESAPVICMGAQYNYPYDNIVEISCDFQKSGARTLGTF